MKAWAVRLAETKEPVGVFFGASLDDLVYHVDECTNPSDCEYTVLPSSGGVFFPLPTSNAWRGKTEEEADMLDSEPMHVSLCDGWGEVEFSEDVKWVPL